MYMIICEIGHQSSLMHETGCSGLVHWDDPEGGDGEGGRGVVQDGEHIYGKSHHNKVISLQLK